MMLTFCETSKFHSKRKQTKIITRVSFFNIVIYYREDDEEERTSTTIFISMQ